ncbi:hypothetical protein FPQ18DRAFT_303488 [Pyronema domesticum]|nr:hypothetical protein FPQ18DRAFT_303488 [Pyronema domesticum]
MLSVNSNGNDFGAVLQLVLPSAIDPHCDFGEPHGLPQWVEHILLLFLCFTAHRLDVSQACPVPIETPLLLNNDKAVDQLVRLKRDTDMGTRRYRLRREALLNGKKTAPADSVRNGPRIGRTRKNGREIGTRNRCLNGPTRREAGKRTLPEKERPEMP